ncbi:MAG TPA: hypothetical protein VLM79_24365, partial [Kofleriaceae bacterium]|nr:hypothetical protein [Kofleriaceae bacterium]
DAGRGDDGGGIDGPPPVGPFLLTVAPTGGIAAARSVTSGDSLIDCGTTCTHSYAGGTSVTLTAAAVTGKGLVFQSWTGDCAASTNAPTCTIVMNQAHSVGATFAPVNYVFISASAFNPSQGVPAGDTLCQTEATARGFPDANRYIAWLSDTSTSARSRLQASRGWVRLDGLPVLDSSSDVNHILYPPRLGSLGQDLSSVTVITGTDATGVSAANCLNFSTNASMSAIGNPGSGAGGWTNAGSLSCGTADLHIYCFGTSAVAQVSPPAGPARIAFVSDGTFTPTAGRSAADTLCQTEATASSFPGNYLALMSLIAAAASDRFDTTGPTWVRRDGVQLTTRPADLFAGDGLVAAFDVTGTTKYLDVSDRIWTGSDKPNTPGMFVDGTCNDWSDANSSGAVGAPSTTSNIIYFHSESEPCTTPHRVYCLQR